LSEVNQLALFLSGGVVWIQMSRHVGGSQHAELLLTNFNRALEIGSRLSILLATLKESGIYESA